MRWNQQSKACRLYLVVIYAVSLPATAYCLTRGSSLTLGWALLTLASIFVATINVRLPKISSVISMGDVFVILALLYYGAGAALLMYWIDITVAHLTDIIRRHGVHLLSKIPLDRFVFNLSCCSLSIAAIDLCLRGGGYFTKLDPLPPPSCYQ